MWYKWEGWVALSSLADIFIGILTLFTIIIAFYQIVDDKKTKIDVFAIFKEGNYTLKYHDKIYKWHKNKKLLDVINAQVSKNNLMVTITNKSNYPIEIFQYTIYGSRNILAHLLLSLLGRMFKLDYDLCKKRSFFAYRNKKNIILKPNETEIKYIPLERFRIMDILFYDKLSWFILSSMNIKIKVECYPKKIEKKLGISLYTVLKEFESNYNAVLAISYYINGDDSIK